MSTYKADLPSNNITLDPRIAPFFETFYAVSDNPDTHNEYVDSMTSDGVLIMGSKKATGKDDIMGLRKALWSGPVKNRKHHLHRVYPFTAQDVMVHGSVDYELHNGKSLAVEWAAHAQFVESDDGKLRMRFYQVYLDSAPVAQAASS